MEHLDECFRSLLLGTYGNVRYMLIDNGSGDGSVAFMRSNFGNDPRVEILELGANLGWSRGNNAGIRKALEDGADYVFLLNNDTSTAPEAIARLVEMAESNPKIGALAPKMLMFDEPSLLNSIGLECSIIASSWDKGIGRLDGDRWNDSIPVIGACGGAAFFRADALKIAGLLPEDFEIYLDDLDLCLRIWNAGYEIWSCPTARIRHKFSATTGQGAWRRRKYYLNTRNRFYVIARNYPASKLLQVTTRCVVGEIRAVGRALLDREPWRAAAHIRAWFAGIAYAFKAAPERLRGENARGSADRFWSLIRKDKMFFEGTEFPERGWHSPRMANGVECRPISSRAEMEVPPGQLRVSLMNCYPALGQASVEVLLNGRRVALLETFDRQERVIEVSGGLLAFVSRRIFDADKTGERMDIGGWIRIEPMERTGL
jgi:GT2 family glycosyltransferase